MHNKPITVDLLSNAEEDFYNLELKVQKKLLIQMRKLEIGLKLPSHQFEKLSPNIWELKVSSKDKWYRLLAFWDGEGDEATLLLCTHMFAKTTNKTPKQEIDKAEKIRKIYLNEVYGT